MAKAQRKSEVVHDRVASSLPINSVVTEAIVPDPYSKTGDKIRVLRSLRDDPLAWLYSRSMIDTAQFAAGRRCQRLYDTAKIGGAKAIDFTKQKVDGGNPRDPLTNHQIDALRQITDLHGSLGAFSARLVMMILGDGKQIAEAAQAFGFSTKSEIEYFGRRFRSCLEEMAILWNLAPPKRAHR